jgi:hypothetical protein
MGVKGFLFVVGLALVPFLAFAADFTVNVDRVALTNINLLFSSKTDSYYRVYSSTFLTGTWSVAEMELGVSGLLSWTSSVPPEVLARYYRISKIIQTNALDGDSDGMDDVYELNRTFLNPLSSGDSLTDYDDDGIPNLSEYRRNTDPNNSGSRNVTLYADPIVGSASYDGLASNVLTSTRGPKREIQTAFAAAISGDAIQAAAGTYPETQFDPGTNSLTLIPSGSVVIP